MNELDQLCINTIRMLSVDTVQQAESGHPGMPMGAATMAYVLWTRHLRHNPKNPAWPDRDRFVLSAGHASALLYSLLHLTGYDLSLDDLKQFRQWDSRTPGHPERGCAPGVEVTTGPLGQGLGNALGLAIAERWLAATFNRPEHEVVNHHTYVLSSDGDMMEGLSSEAASLAGTLRLGRLIVLYDANRVTLAGTTDLTFREDVGGRFEACGWHVQRVDGQDVAAVDGALTAARAVEDRPSLIVARTHIGYGSPKKQDTFQAHGEPLGADEVRATKRALGWPEDPPFHIPHDALQSFACRATAARQSKRRGSAEWTPTRRVMPTKPTASAEPSRASCPPAGSPICRRSRLPTATWPRATPAARCSKHWRRSFPTWSAVQPTSTLHAYRDERPGRLREPGAPARRGRSEDTRGRWRRVELRGAQRSFRRARARDGRGADRDVVHGGLVPFGATFLSFSDYMRPSMRLAALSQAHVIYVFTHDSLALGEDGPTHQPVEHLASLRAIPNMMVVRPSDATETVEAWRAALARTGGPVALILTRQKLPVIDRTAMAPASGLAKGAYVLVETAGESPDVILIATGSEVALALDVYARSRRTALPAGSCRCRAGNCSRRSRRRTGMPCCRPTCARA